MKRKEPWTNPTDLHISWDMINLSAFAEDHGLARG